MLDKIKEILGSVRFYIITLTAIVAILEAQVAGTLTAASLLDTIKLWLGAVVTIGTVDSVATKFGTSFGQFVSGKNQ